MAGYEETTVTTRTFLISVNAEEVWELYWAMMQRVQCRTGTVAHDVFDALAEITDRLDDAE